MNEPFARLAGWLAEEGAAALVTITAVRGSSPREEGTRMLVRRDGRISGTIGGGALEWQAIALAQQSMMRHPGGHGFVRSFALGPDMGQCCGGQVTLRIEALASADLAWLQPLARARREAPDSAIAGQTDTRGVLIRRIATQDAPAADNSHHEPGPAAATPLLLFGAGHVGRALVLAMAPLPFALRWIDTRRDLFPGHAPANTMSVATDDPLAEIAAAPAGAFVLAMTHSHALDLDLMAAALGRTDLGYIGVIGSATKRARFLGQLRRLGHDEGALQRMICPVGVPDLGSKDPAVIAAGIAVELLQRRAALAASREATDFTRRISPA